MNLFFSSLWLAIVAWLIVRAFNQRGLLPSVAPNSPLMEGEVPRIIVIVPARDEAANIGRCLDSLFAQDYPASRLSVIVIDDHSADSTASIVRRIAADHPQLTLLSSPPLPPRWVGKSHACWIGARAASDSEWLCFLDADVWGEAGLLSCAMQAALLRKLDLLSLAPRQELKSFAERLMMPCGLLLLSFIQDLRKVQAPSGPGVTVTGQFMLMRRDVYEAVGGHAAVCGAICEDLELARRIKQAGYTVLMMSGENVLSTRMYTGWRTLWPGLTKNLVDTVGGTRAALTLMPAALVLAWAAVALPLIDAAGCAGGGGPAAWAALTVALLASGAAFGIHIATTFYFRIPFFYGLLFPIGYTIGAIMGMDSVRRRLTGKVIWKGRIYS
ncbi:MAG: glycosyltransferase [Xanthobacteraceae bacterium]